MQKKLIFLVFSLVFALFTMGAVSADVTIDKTAVKTGPDSATVNLAVSGTGTATTSAADVVFAIDSSGSMAGSDPQGLRKSAANNFIDQMDSSKDKVGVVNWDSGIQSETNGLTNDNGFTVAKNVVNSGYANSGTNAAGGISAAITQLDSDSVLPASQKFIIFVTDGYFDSDSAALAQANIAATKGYTIYTIGLGSNVNTAILTQIAQITSGQYYYAADASALDPIFNAIFQQINTAATNVVVTDVLPNYMQLVGDPSILPDSKVTNADGTTTLVWNVGTLNVGQIWSVKYNLRSSRYGMDLPTNIAGLSSVSYTDPAGVQRTSVLPVPVLSFEDPNAETTVNAANTIGMQETGTPLAGIALAILMVLGGFLSTRKK